MIPFNPNLSMICGYPGSLSDADVREAGSGCHGVPGCRDVGMAPGHGPFK